MFKQNKRGKFVAQSYVDTYGMVIRLGNPKENMLLEVTKPKDIFDQIASRFAGLRAKTTEDLLSLRSLIADVAGYTRIGWSDKDWTTLNNLFRRDLPHWSMGDESPKEEKAKPSGESRKIPKLNDEGRLVFVEEDWDEAQFILENAGPDIQPREGDEIRPNRLLQNRGRRGVLQGQFRAGAIDNRQARPVNPPNHFAALWQAQIEQDMARMELRLANDFVLAEAPENNNNNNNENN